MKLHHHPVDRQKRFTGHGPGFVLVNGERFESGLVVLPDRVEIWEKSFERLEPADFSMILEWAPQVVLFGSGATQRFPHPSLYRALLERQIGVEVMDTPAACRTYNILLEEGRQVACAILL